MLAIIGTYRKDAYLWRLLESLKENAWGLTDLHFVDDSGDEDFAKKLRDHGDVTETHAQGYNAAMQEVCRIGTEYNDHAAFIEEDFTLTKATDFNRLAAHIDTHPYLAQVVLLRNAWFEEEIEAGGVMEAIRKRRFSIRERDGFQEHGAFFSCNPAVWNKDIFPLGWPEGAGSENRKRLQLLRKHYKFAISPDIRCHHDGIRSGKDY